MRITKNDWWAWITCAGSALAGCAESPAAASSVSKAETSAPEATAPAEMVSAAKQEPSPAPSGTPEATQPETEKPERAVRRELPTLADARSARWLWSGSYPSGTALVSPDMGAAFLVPEGMTAKFEWGYQLIELASDDGKLKATVWLASDVDPTEIDRFLREEKWTDRAGKPMPLTAEGQTNGRREAELRTDLDLGLGTWIPGPGRSGIASWAWGSPDLEDRMRSLHDQLAASAVHFPAMRTARGLYGLKWLGWLGGKKLVRYETYSSSGGSGYSNKWRIDLCWDGSFTQSTDFSMSFGEVGSAAGFDPSKGVWAIEARQPNLLTLIMQAQGGNQLTYQLSYDPTSERTYLGNSRYFRVPNEWCEFPNEPALPPEVLQMLGASTSAPSTKAPSKAKASSPGSSDLEGQWLSRAEGFALTFEGDRYTFHVHDDSAGWVFVDAGRLERNGSQLVFRSEDGEVERHAFRLEGDRLTLELESTTVFERQR